VAQQKDEQPLDIETLLSDLSVKVERVKVLYEQYFMGIEKIEPQVARKDIQRTMLMLQQMYIRNTGLRFKFNTLLQKWNIYITYWNRILREIEAGTYTRHLAKAQRAASREGKAVPEELMHKGKVRPPSGTFDTGPGASVDKGFLDRESGRHPVARNQADNTDQFEVLPPSGLKPAVPARPAPPSGAKPPPLPPGVRPPMPPMPPGAASVKPTTPRPAPAIPGMSENELRALHQKYAAARKQAGEAQVSYETLVNSLAKQVPNVLKQPGVKSVSFDVAVKDGKAVLKAIPQKK
jgi:hypothetical protein